MITPPFTATVRQAGGGTVVLVVDPDTIEYPDHAARLLVSPLAEPLLDQPAGSGDLRAGPEAVDDLARIDNEHLVRFIAEAADRHDTAREAALEAGRRHAEALADVDRARRAARQLAAELNRRLAR